MEPNPLPAPTVEIVEDLVTAATGSQTQLIDYGFGEPVMIELRPDGSCWVNGKLVVPHNPEELD